MPTPSPNKFYFEEIQPAIFVVLLLTTWAVVFIRVRLFLSSMRKWNSFPGLSVIFILLSASLYTSYIFVNFAVLATNKKISNIYTKWIPEEQVNEYYERYPENFSDAEVKEIIRLWVNLMRMLLAQRILITVGLWVVKAAFVTVFWGMKESFGPMMIRFLRGVTFFMAASMGVTAWLCVKDNLPGFPLDPIIEDEIRYATLFTMISRSKLRNV